MSPSFALSNLMLRVVACRFPLDLDGSWGLNILLSPSSLLFITATPINVGTGSYFVPHTLRMLRMKPQTRTRETRTRYPGGAGPSAHSSLFVRVQF
ncbi:hypothetical protein FPV67DRAFT_1097624 [Lyophyllum atratum]|nr:hypothetical protein FPV67DRAFT_1097624 [Lyophyllum atratum]